MSFFVATICDGGINVLSKATLCHAKQESCGFVDTKWPWTRCFTKSLFTVEMQLLSAVASVFNGRESMFYYGNMFSPQSHCFIAAVTAWFYQKSLCDAKKRNIPSVSLFCSGQIRVVLSKVTSPRNWCILRRSVQLVGRWSANVHCALPVGAPCCRVSLCESGAVCL